MDTVLLSFEASMTMPAVADGPDRRDTLGLPAKDGNLADTFSRVAAIRGKQLAVVAGNAHFPYQSLLRASQQVHAYLRSRADYSPGMRVALKLSNSPEYLAAFYGTLLADCVVVPLPVAIENLRWRQIQDLCNPQLMFSRREDFGDSNESTSQLILTATAGKANSDAKPGRRGDDLAMVLFTSGSTGTPKGVMLSHLNLLANASSILRDLPILPNDRTLVLVPFYHSFGNSILQTHILAGATMSVGAKLAFPESIVQALVEFEATSFSAIPEVFGMLLKYGRLGEKPMTALRYMTVAGGGMRPDMAADVAARIAPATFHVMYGQSEASARLASLPPDQLTLRRGSIGRPIPGVELAIRDDSGNGLPAGEVGTLHARGDNVMLGYWNDEEGTAKVLNKEGWLNTGDLAHCDNDGYFYIDGRANLLVKVQGHRVHPSEIEGVVEASFPNTRAVALPMTRGEETRFALFVAPQNDQPIDLAEVRATCVRELPSYKVPLHFEILEDLPLTSAYKVDRAALSTRIPQ